MFVREKRNKSGTVSVQIISKVSGRYRVLRSMGCARHADEVAFLVRKASDLIPVLTGQAQMDFVLGDDSHFAAAVSDGIESVRLLGPGLVLGKLFDEVGFGVVPDSLFRDLVIMRLVHPVSKLKTTEYLARYNGVEHEVGKIYRYLDKLGRKQLKKVQKASFDHSMRVLGGELSVVFYDVTTLYFEAEKEDDLRKAGYSKDGKHQNPQILLGLLVSVGGYPLAYGIFEGNRFEGHTMLPVIEGFKKQYKLGKLVVVADAGLLSKENVGLLVQGGHEFILGARIRNEPESVKGKVLGLKLADGESEVISRPDGTRLVVSYSEKRAGKDGHNRERGLAKLRKRVEGGKLTKEHVNNRGYGKFLSMEGQVTVAVDEDKVLLDALWDGLKGYVTNSTLGKLEVIENYRQLWSIEKAFRISKTDLRVRPVYHRLKSRIEAHIGIAFAAYKIYKELERQLREKNLPYTPEKAIEILKTIYGIKLRLPQTGKSKTILVAKADEQQKLLTAFGF